MTPADLIIRARTERNISMNELARRSGKDVSHIWRIEHGRQEPTLPLMRVIADGLDCEFVMSFIPKKINKKELDKF